MKKYIIKLVLLFCSILVFYGCEFGIPTGGSVTINGQVVESVTGNPLTDVNIKIYYGNQNTSATTNSNGKFSASFDLQNDTTLVLISSKPGYGVDTVSVFATIGTTITVPIIQLQKEEGIGNGESGNAASIYLYSQSVQSIGVKESGSNETAQIIFEVLDASGTPINSNHSVTLKFSFGSNPGGGEYLYPASVMTNALGRGTVTLNSGTKAGVAQVIAQFSDGSKNVLSRPVMIAIYGGLPDDQHFDVASDKLNYPEWGIVGYSIDFTAFVGDKYSNPVRPGTSVYFNTTSGIIDGSNLTDDLGRASVTLLTQPFPNLNEPGYGPGFFRLTATTVNENNDNIQTTTVRLLTGLPQITVNPATFDIPNGGSQIFNYTVSDGNNNPLSEGQTISVKVSKGDLQVSGDIDITLLDTQSKTFTFFSFTATDSKPDTVRPHQAIVDIQTSGPNGDKKYSITGTAR